LPLRHNLPSRQLSCDTMRLEANHLLAQISDAEAGCFLSPGGGGRRRDVSSPHLRRCSWRWCADWDSSCVLVAQTADNQPRCMSVCMGGKSACVCTGNSACVCTGIVRVWVRAYPQTYISQIRARTRVRVCVCIHGAPKHIRE